MTDQWEKECWVCDGTEPKAFSHKCEKHDVCIRCGIKRADVEGVPWGTRKGFICNKCQEEKWAERIAAFTEKDFKENDFEYRSDLKCPYCGHEWQPYDVNESTEDVTCPHCNSYMDVDVEWTADFCIRKAKSDKNKEE